MSVEDVLNRDGPRKILALDGGGIRAVIAIEVLAAIEDQFSALRGKRRLLAEEFDLVAGSGSGAIVAILVSMGMTVDEIRTRYQDLARDMYRLAPLLRRALSRYDDARLRAGLQELIGEATPVGTDRLRTLLLVVLRNATTDSTWPLSNNPRAKFNNRRGNGEGSNLDIPLWRIARASAANPVLFSPIELDVGGSEEFVFVDGGTTPYNNPAFLAFLTATVEPYNVSWPAATDRMLITSLGTGGRGRPTHKVDPKDMNLLYQVSNVPAALMSGTLFEQDVLCRVFGDCRHGDVLDSEIGALLGVPGPLERKLFTYLRYNVDLTPAWLEAHGLDDIDARDLLRADSIKHLSALQTVGLRLAEQVHQEHFADF